VKKKKLRRRLERAERAFEDEVARNRRRDALRDEEWMEWATRLNQGTRPPKPRFSTDYLSGLSGRFTIDEVLVSAPGEPRMVVPVVRDPSCPPGAVFMGRVRHEDCGCVVLTDRGPETRVFVTDACPHRHSIGLIRTEDRP